MFYKHIWATQCIHVTIIKTNYCENSSIFIKAIAILWRLHHILCFIDPDEDLHDNKSKQNFETGTMGCIKHDI